MLTAISARTGEVLERSKVLKDNRAGFAQEQFDRLKASGASVVLLHNHPIGDRFSWTDIRTAFAHEFVAASVVIGHDGTVRILRDLDRSINVESLYKELYNEVKKKYPLKSLAEKITLDKIYDSGVFVYGEEK